MLKVLVSWKPPFVSHSDILSFLLFLLIKPLLLFSWPTERYFAEQKRPGWHVGWQTIWGNVPSCRGSTSTWCHMVEGNSANSWQHHNNGKFHQDGPSNVTNEKKSLSIILKINGDWTGPWGQPYSNSQW